jgi:hypothetical protein
MSSSAQASGDSATDLARAVEDAAARRQQAPCRSPHDERGSANSRSRSAKAGRDRIAGSMKMWRWSKAATSLMYARQQHAVAEHVARHVADADHGEGVVLDVRPARGSGASPIPTRRAR